MVAKRPRPTTAELRILRVLWKQGPLSVRDVHNILNTSTHGGYTSVLKTMQIMLDKGLVDRDDSGRPQIYRARYSEERTQKELLTDLVQRVYNGSIKAMVVHALGTRKPSAEDLETLERLLDRYDRGRK